MKLHYIGVHNQELRDPLTRALLRERVERIRSIHKGQVRSILWVFIGAAWLIGGMFSYGEFMTVFSKTVAERTKPGQRQDIEQDSNTFHAYGRTEGVCGIIISDHEYPALVAHQLLSKVVDEFLNAHPRSEWADSNPTLSFPELNDYIVKYQDPQQADSIMKIQKELDETKIVLHKTIESVLERGEKIDTLVAKSDGLSAQSKMFYTQAKKQNSCCVAM
ncbi:palmitoyltransferase [Ciborinia camelliae]|nr:palmitoyltransferase [Ciborinia camelliae]